MEGIVYDNNAGVLSELDEPNVAEWIKLRSQLDENIANTTSLTKLDGLEGSYEEDVYGAEFQNVDGVLHTPYYDRFLTQRVAVPWLAQKQEATYMNRTKELNEEPYKSYRELRFSPIPSEKHGKANLESFDAGQEWIFKIISLILIVFVIYRIMIEIK